MYFPYVLFLTSKSVHLIKLYFRPLAVWLIQYLAKYVHFPNVCMSC